MKYLAITILAVFLSSCILTKSAGGFDVSGKVVNEVTNEPIKDEEYLMVPVLGNYNIERQFLNLRTFEWLGFALWVGVL